MWMRLAHSSTRGHLDLELPLNFVPFKILMNLEHRLWPTAVSNALLSAATISANLIISAAKLFQSIALQSKKIICGSFATTGRKQRFALCFGNVRNVRLFDVLLVFPPFLKVPVSSDSLRNLKLSSEKLTTKNKHVCCVTKGTLQQQVLLERKDREKDPNRQIEWNIRNHREMDTERRMLYTRQKSKQGHQLLIQAHTCGEVSAAQSREQEKCDV